MQLDLVARNTPLWHGAAKLVNRTFAEKFEAAVSPEPDAFVIARPTVADGADGERPTDEVLACSGVNFGNDEPFFSECYLDGAAEEVVSEHVGVPCERGEIVEFGAIASQAFQAGTEVIKALPVFCWSLGKTHAICTLTRPLSRLVERVGYEFEPLADARVDRLPADHQHRWGNYYEQGPRTGVVRLTDVSHAFNSNLGRYHVPELSITVAEDVPTAGKRSGDSGANR